MVRLSLCVCVCVFRKCVHSLIQLSLPSGVSEVEERVLEEVWVYYEQALSIITAAVSQQHLPPQPPPLARPLPSPSSLCIIINPLCSSPMPARYPQSGFLLINSTGFSLYCGGWLVDVLYRPHCRR